MNLTAYGNVGNSVTVLTVQVPQGGKLIGIDIAAAAALVAAAVGTNVIGQVLVSTTDLLSAVSAVPSGNLLAAAMFLLEEETAVGAGSTGQANKFVETDLKLYPGQKLFVHLTAGANMNLYAYVTFMIR